MIRRPPRSTQSRSSAASDVYKRQVLPPGRTLGPPATEHVCGSVAANPQLVRGDVHVRVLGAPHDARDPSGALGVTISGDVGIPDEHERDVTRPLAHLELRARVELGRNVMGIDVLGVDSGVVYRAHTGSVLIIVESGEPGGQALDGCLEVGGQVDDCLLYTSDAADDLLCVD